MAPPRKTGIASQQDAPSLLPWAAWGALVGAVVGGVALAVMAALAFDDASAAVYGLPLGIACGLFLGALLGGIGYIVKDSLGR